MECADDFVQLPKRKRKADHPCKTPVKKRKPSKKRLLDAMKEMSDDEQSQVLIAAKGLINDQAEGNHMITFRLSKDNFSESDSSAASELQSERTTATSSDDDEN